MNEPEPIRISSLPITDVAVLHLDGETRKIGFAIGDIVVAKGKPGAGLRKIVDIGRGGDLWWQYAHDPNDRPTDDRKSAERMSPDIVRHATADEIKWGHAERRKVT